MKFTALNAALLAGTAVFRMMPDVAGDGSAADSSATAGATPPPPPEPTPAPAQKVSPGRIVQLTFGGGAELDGSPTAVGIVTAVLDNGAINVRAFNPSGGADPFYTGVLQTDDVDSMPEGADKNAALSVTWDWPPRV